MKSMIIWALGALNLVLLAALVAPYLGPSEAMAQRAAGRRPDILMIPGEVVGGNSAVVYLIDSANRQLGAVSLNQKGNGLDVLEPQDLDRIFEDRPAAAPAGGRGR